MPTILLDALGKSKSGKFIFRASFTKNGVTYYARNYGKKAFKIYI